MTMAERKPFEIFRKEDYRAYGEHNIMPITDASPAVFEALGQFHREGGGAIGLDRQRA